MRVLVTAAGAGPGVALIKAIRRMGGFVVGVDGREQASGLYLADAHATVPLARDPEYIPTLIALCKEHDLGMVVPILDVETPHVARARETLAAEGSSRRGEPAGDARDLQRQGALVRNV